MGLFFKKIFFVFIISVLLLLNQGIFMGSALAADSCNETSYCQNGQWYAKKCSPDPVAERTCQKTGEGCDKQCICDFIPLNETCDSSNPNKDNEINAVFGKVNPPRAVNALGFGQAGIGTLIQKIIQLIYAFAAVAFVILFLVSGLQFILSGGDKEGVAKARQRLTWAIIGLVVLALAFVIFRILGAILGVDILNPKAF